jgi:hypothetical protein
MTTEQYLRRMKSIPKSIEDKWRRLKKLPIYQCIIGVIDKTRNVRELQDYVAMSERERRRAWRTVFLYQRIVKTLAKSQRSVVFLETDEKCPRCSHKTRKFVIKPDGYVSCEECSNLSSYMQDIQLIDLDH